MKSILNNQQIALLENLKDDGLFTKNFYLSGGTALSEYYLHHRYSEDLDFFCEKEIDQLWLAALAKHLKKSTVATRSTIEQSFNRNLVFFEYGKELVKTEFTYYPFKQIEKPRQFDDLAVDSLIDIAVNKFFTIYQKPSSRHFIDLYLILKSKKVKWDTLAKLARVKFDTVIDPLQLGSQLVVAETISDLPRMLVPVDDHAWRKFFLNKAHELKKDVLS